MQNKIQVLDKTFGPFISASSISNRVQELGRQITSDYAGKNPLFLPVLNGSFMFASDLLKAISIPAELSFVKLASYHGTSSSGQVNELIGLTSDLSGRHVLIVEDIVDSGNTLEKLHQLIQSRNAASIRIVTCLFKPGAYAKPLPVDYVGFEIPNDFVVGYGMDYNGFGRNLSEIYTLIA